MFENFFGRKPETSPVGDLPKMNDAEREEALAQIEALKQGGHIKLTPEEEAAHEETERLRNLRNEA